MTDKELKKLSRLELLELLLVESRENERLREELEKIKKVNTLEKSAQQLNETAQQLEEALKQVSSMIGGAEQNSVRTAVPAKTTRKQKPKSLKGIKKDVTDRIDKIKKQFKIIKK